MTESTAAASETLKDTLALIGGVSPEATEMIFEARKACSQLCERLEKAESTLAEIREALKLYATEKGDPIFLQEFELACRMVRGGKK